ncbi:hypothetical protein IAQ61_010068 [Plenodomus lingam]|uniref:BTB domain-containing protein n=1 Tax=Leptosphaeria maculans (strain JN3 / isolate v23.1.3 / race Av1-4-5-6-7-8) TaxID=985895 RepID=E5AEQ8_LEPMJ|nr:hypothetical protein LEMA_P004840.1 [Plenodomus lingam JN3]KAH9862650.1 hypothetical protein IAQ61_010068 [Plenodomus lingam]CBY01697.1 hypothetical protein LEMA_P004840.1 [Plenodomus lingam JN3]
MAKTKYEITADPDTIIILQNPDAAFASWSLTGGGRDHMALAHESAVDNSAVDNPAVEYSAVDNPVVEYSAVDEITPGGAEQETDLIIANEANKSNSTEGDEVWYYVSRRHLTAVSPKFERVLVDANWKEGTRDENDGLFHVSATDWDSEALRYFLQVLHLRNSQVPREVSLEMLAKIAVLIDFYDCAEALEPFTERWVEHARVVSPVPSDFCRDLILWMCIAWVLKLPNEFLQTTRVAIKENDREFPTLGLPITACVDRIEESRTQAIDTIFSQLQSLLEELGSPQYQCPSGYPFECGSMLYGALTKEMDLQQLLPAPVAPYSGLSMVEVYKRIQRIRSPVWFFSGHRQKQIQHSCDLRVKVMAIADSATRLAIGPGLEDFKSH